MNITLICVGKLKEEYWRQAQEEYAKRLTRYGTLQVVEVRERDDIEKEGEDILKRIREEDYLIALAIEGKTIDSITLSRYLENLSIQGKSNITFVIGGSLGLSKVVLERADLRLSFSKLTFPHQMIRIFLLEQIYRSYKIMKGEVYHK
jgi:23S rRNA (pseudouridine1915-N3)-methyltransferase